MGNKTVFPIISRGWIRKRTGSLLSSTVVGCARVQKIGRMRPMKALSRQGLMVVVGMCCAALLCPSFVTPAHASASPQTASSSGPTKRWAQFELSQAGSTGDPQTGKPVTLTIVLGGVPIGMTPVVSCTVFFCCPRCAASE
jgi:hypothetical protein